MMVDQQLLLLRNLGVLQERFIAILFGMVCRMQEGKGLGEVKVLENELSLWWRLLMEKLCCWYPRKSGTGAKQ